MYYNWQQKDWRNFIYEIDDVEALLYRFAEKVGKTKGLIDGLSDEEETDAIIELMASEAIKTSEIENEQLRRDEIVSSIKMNLGLRAPLDRVFDKRAEGVSELMVDVRKQYHSSLTCEMIFSWHRMLMKGNSNIKAGRWRKGPEPMRIVSGSYGKEVIHFEAPPESEVAHEMDEFIDWFNGSSKKISQPPIRAAIAHVYFESIHPFEDGNGRIGRAISEKALSEGIGSPVLMSLSKTIEADKPAYYMALKEAQSSNNLTNWINYFVPVLVDAQHEAEQMIAFSLKKSKFFNRFEAKLNTRQIKVIRRMLDAGISGFEGGMNAKKYMSISKTSKATATRDLQDLVEKSVFQVEGMGRGTRYALSI